MNKWLKLDDTLYLFGPSGITRVEELDAHSKFLSKGKYNTALFQGTTKIQIVSATVDEIQKMLTNQE